MLQGRRLHLKRRKSFVPVRTFPQLNGQPCVVGGEPPVIGGVKAKQMLHDGMVG